MNRIGKLVWLLSPVMLGYLYRHYRCDKAQVLKHLRAGSEVVQLDIGPVEVAIEGDGKPMLCIHGGGGGYEQGMMMGRLLNSDATFKLIAPSRTGARRTPLSNGIAFKQQAKAYCQLLDYLKIDKAVIVALSGGGLSSLQFALDYPDRCEALILISAVSPLSAQLHVPEVALKVLDGLMASDMVMWILQKLSWNILLWTDGRERDDFEQNSPVFDLISNFFPSSDWRDNVMAEMQELYAVGDFPFEDVTVPTLLLHGDDDPVIPLLVAENTAKRIPDAQLIVIPNGSHLMLGTDTAILQQQLKSFLQNKRVPM